MFCQNCGAELRLEEGFCPVCGASAPRPVLRQAAEERSKAQPLNTPPQQQSASSRAYTPTAGSSLLGDTPTHHTAQPARQMPSFQAIRQASGQRGSARSLAPVASLAVPASPPEPPAPQPEIVQADAPIIASVPIPPAYANGHAPALQALPLAQDTIQPHVNGYHPADTVVAANGHAPQYAHTLPLASSALPASAAISPTRSIRLPVDIPNRLALSALAAMFLSFLLPWVIISGARATPLSIGWPVLVPLAAILAVGLTILLPERTLYTRFVLALPFAFGCFALGSALVVFLVSSAIAANSVGAAFLGVDFGFIIFTLAAAVLASAGYFKLLRELPLLHAGRITLAPLPGGLGRVAANPAPRPPVAQQPTPNAINPSSAAGTIAADRSGPSA